MKNEKLLAAVLAATMLSAPLTGCGHSRKSLEEIKNENEIRRLLQQDSSITITTEDADYNCIGVSWHKFFGNYYLNFQTIREPYSASRNPFVENMIGPRYLTITIYKVDCDTYFNFIKNYGQEQNKAAWVYKETKKDVDLIREITEKFDPIVSDYVYTVEDGSDVNTIEEIGNFLAQDDVNKILTSYFGTNITKSPYWQHGMEIECEQENDQYFVNFIFKEDTDENEYSENIVDYGKMTYQVDQSAYDYFKNVDLKDLANIDPVPFEVLTDQYDPVSVEVFENLNEENQRQEPCVR